MRLGPLTLWISKEIITSPEVRQFEVHCVNRECKTTRQGLHVLMSEANHRK